MGIYSYIGGQRPALTLSHLTTRVGRVMLLGRSAIRPEVSDELLMPTPPPIERATGRGLLHTRGGGAEVFDAYYLSDARATDIAAATAHYNKPL